MTEGTNIGTEGSEQTQAEDAKSTQEQKQPTMGRVYSEEDFQRAVSKGLESIQKQLDLRQSEASKAKAEVEQHKAEIAARDAQIEAMQREIDEALADDPERRKAYIDRIKALDREQKIAKKNAEAEDKLYQAEIRVWQAGMGLKAQELAAEFPHLNLDLKELIANSATEEELEKKVLRLDRVFQKAETKEAETIPKFETGISSGGGLPTHPTVEQLDKWSTDQYARWWKKRQEEEVD